VIILAQVLLTLSALWIGLAVAFDAVEYWMLLATSAIQAAAFALFGPARMAFTAELVDGETLPNAVSLGQMSAEAMRVIGPTVAGLLLAAGTLGEKAVFLGCAALCAVSLVTSFWLPPGNPMPGRPARSPWEEMREGLAYVRHHDVLLLLVGASLGVVMIGFPYMAFLPTLAGSVFDVGAGGYGIMSAVTSIGAVSAALVAARQGSHADLWKRLVVSGLAFGAAIVLLGLSPTYPAALVVLFAIGATALLFQTANQSLLLMLSDFEYHGRLQGIVMLSFSGFGIAALPLGILADAIGIRQTLVLMGVASFAIIAVVGLRGRGRSMIPVARDFG
jgi:MFS family permease